MENAWILGPLIWSKLSKRGCRVPRTVESILILKGECSDPWTADLVRILKRGCRDPRTAESVQIFKRECRKYQMGLKRGQKSDRAVKWIFKTWTMAEKCEIPTSSGQIWTDFLWELNRPHNIQPGGLKPAKKSNQPVKSTWKRLSIWKYGVKIGEDLQGSKSISFFN